MYLDNKDYSNKTEPEEISTHRPIGKESYPSFFQVSLGFSI